MRHDFPLKGRWSGLCAEPSEDDGLDRRCARRAARGRLARAAGGHAHNGGARGPAGDRKACQLCRQVAVTLDEVFADCGDAVLRGLHVVDVAPFPDTSRLMVAVASVDGKLERERGAEAVMERLQHASGHLRCEVAAAVTRKRAPLLVYRLACPTVLSPAT